VRADTMGIIGIIGGTGWLGGALAEAMLDGAFITPDRLLLSNRSGSHPLAETGARLLADNQALVDASATVIIAVRPEQFKALTIDASGKRVISLMAGVSSRAIIEATGAATVVRAMANAAVEIRRSFTPWHCTSELTPSEVEFIQGLLECVGTASRVPSEHCIDYLSAMSGTGPAFPALLMTALIHQAIDAGVPEDVARQAAHGVVVSASQLLDRHDSQAMIDSLVAYKGVTAAALQSLMDAGFEDMLGRALESGVTVARNGL